MLRAADRSGSGDEQAPVTGRTRARRSLRVAGYKDCRILSRRAALGPQLAGGLSARLTGLRAGRTMAARNPGDGTRWHGMKRRIWAGPVLLVAVALTGPAVALGEPVPALASSGATYAIGAVTNISASCSGQNAEVEQAVDPALGYVYEDWMGCNGIAFARSTDGGRSFDTPISVPVGGVQRQRLGSGGRGRAGRHRVRRLHGREGSQWYPVVDGLVRPRRDVQSGRRR